MIIIRKPNPLPEIEQFRFMCQRCGCDFIAEREEVQIEHMPDGVLVVSCKCPFCNHAVGMIYEKEVNT